ncbi:hypothetical protein BpHYR1_034519 [Brachionus plicatilis]|uniref:Uncharacterized protein n=1 Tax=Brachionus plicatilis TaxID=10195 RepID=A0A3M7RQ06_BRAPC|nr:hypothetical protein BpHYR1_034519 [Brachionus plicatilis]
MCCLDPRVQISRNNMFDSRSLKFTINLIVLHNKFDKIYVLIDKSVFYRSITLKKRTFSSSQINK